MSVLEIGNGNSGADAASAPSRFQVFVQGLAVDGHVQAFLLGPR